MTSSITCGIYMPLNISHHAILDGGMAAEFKKTDKQTG